MEFTGERLIPGTPRFETMIVEELSRLNFVRDHFIGKRVLDAGCGVGYGSHFIAENGARFVLGVDIATEAVGHGNAQYRRDNLVFTAMDCSRLAIEDECFDVVCSIELIEHLVEVDRYLREVCRVLDPEGLYYLSTPNRKVSSRPDGQASWPFHEKEFSLDELRELLEGYFAEVEIWGSFVRDYEEHPIRRITKSPLSRIKHFLPARLRFAVSSSIRQWIKSDLHFEDVVYTQEQMEQAPTFVALCSRKMK